MLTIPLPYKLLGLVVAALAIWAHGYTSNNEGERVEAAWEAANQHAIKARQARIDLARAAQDRLQKEADEERRKRDEANRARDARLADALERLRQRPERPGELQRGAVLPPTAGPAPEGGGCTGAGLFRDDAAFLTRGADLAQRIREQRDLCYSQYERAQKEIDRLNAGRSR